MNLDDFRLLTIESKDLFDQYAADTKCVLPSSLQFPGLYSYNDSCICYYRLIEDYLCLVFDDHPTGSFLTVPPLGMYRPDRFQRAMGKLYDLFEHSGLPLVFWEVPLQLLDQFTGLEEFDAQVRHDLTISDYVFSRDSFCDGLNKRSSRQALRHLAAHGEPKWRLISPADEPLLLELTHRYYCAYHKCGECVYGCELDVVPRFMEHFEALGMQGVIAYSNGQPVGCIVAFRERDTLFAFSKRARHGVRGLNEYLNQQMLGLFQGQYQWINYSEDMGNNGLRFYKERLGEHQMHHRFRVTLTPTKDRGKDK